MPLTELGLVTILTILYGTTGPIRAASYVSQILAVYGDNHGAQSTSLLTWAGFLVVWIIQALYGYFVISDIPVTLVGLCGATGSLIILLLASKRRYDFSSQLKKNQCGSEPDFATKLNPSLTKTSV